MVTRGKIDVVLCETLSRRAVEGDTASSQQLLKHLWPFWVEVLRSSRNMGRRARSEDDVNAVIERLVEKLSAKDSRGIRLYFAWKSSKPNKTFEDWIRIITRNAVVDYIRAQEGQARPSGDGVSRKRLLNEFASSDELETIQKRPPFTDVETARQLIAFARTRLSPEHLGALSLWLEEATPEEMGIALNVTAEGATRLLRAGIAILRRHFRPAEELARKKSR